MFAESHTTDYNYGKNIKSDLQSFIALDIGDQYMIKLKIILVILTVLYVTLVKVKLG